MTTYTKMNIIGVVLSSTVGSVFGAILLYQIGHLVPREKLESLLEGRIGKILHFKPEDVGSAMEWFDSKGNYTVLFCRFIPIVRSLISIPAGMAHMNLGTFLSLTTIGSFIWNLVLVALGAIAGTSWQKAAECLGTYTQVARVVILVFALVGILVYIKRRFLQK
jgi:membrane protein DedA with SNARE-associated domain